MLVDTQRIRNRINKYAFDGQYGGFFAEGLIIDKYLDSLAQGEREPVKLSHDGNEVYFSWIPQTWDSFQLKQRVKRIDYISYDCDSLDYLNEFYDVLSPVDLIYMRLSINHPLVKRLKGNSAGLRECAEKQMFQVVVSQCDDSAFQDKIQMFSKLTCDNKNEQLNVLATKAFEVNRFSRDPQLPEGFGHQVYQSWIQDCIQKGENILCYVVDGDVLGFIALTTGSLDARDFLYGFVNLIAVDQAQQGKGIASQLMQAANNYLKQEGVKVLYANVDSENLSSIKFFQRNGFKKFNTIKEYHWRNNT